MPGTIIITAVGQDADQAHAMHWMDYRAGPSIVFGPFHLFPMQRLLTEHDKPVHLGSRAFEILLALIERPGTLLGNEELMARVWPKTFVAPANLAVHISALRRALGDQHPRHRYVVNIPGRGYRFAAPVTIESDLTPGLTIASWRREQNLLVSAAPPARRAETVGELLPQQLDHYGAEICACSNDRHYSNAPDFSGDCSSCVYRRAFDASMPDRFRSLDMKAALDNSG